MAYAALLSADIRLDYLAEGAANVVYRVLPPAFSDVPGKDCSSIPFNTADLHHLPPSENATTPPPSEIDPDLTPLPTVLPQKLHGKLLRLHKDVPWISSYIQLHQRYRTLIAPLFSSSDLVAQELVFLPPGLITACNAALHSAESEAEPIPQQDGTIRHTVSRPRTRQRLYLASDELYGLLVEDLSPRPHSRDILIEMKPKWLVQSPNAPKGSTRCRTCALRAMRASQKRKAEGTRVMSRPDLSTSTEFCPLTLLPLSTRTATSSNGTAKACSSTRPPHTLAALSHKLLFASAGIATLSAGDRQRVQDALANYLHTAPLFAHLAKIQQLLDPCGVLSLRTAESGTQIDDSDDGELRDFLVAMTLRDCSLFIRLELSPPGDNSAVMGEKMGVTVTAKLADLDFKEAVEEKFAYWRGLEGELVRDGWYEARDGGTVGCRFERS